MRDPDPSSSNSSLLRHLKANPGTSKPIHLQCISLITTSGLDWCVRVDECCTIIDDIKVVLCFVGGGACSSLQQPVDGEDARVKDEGKEEG